MAALSFHGVKNFELDLYFIKNYEKFSARKKWRMKRGRSYIDRHHFERFEKQRPFKNSSELNEM